MTKHASWKGEFALGDLTCEVGLYPSVLTHDLAGCAEDNRKTGSHAGRDDAAQRHEATLAMVPENNPIITVEAFIASGDSDRLCLGQSYDMAVTSDEGHEILALLAQSMREEKLIALATITMVHHPRSVLIRPHGERLIVTTLNVDDEMQSTPLWANQCQRNMDITKSYKPLLM